MNLDALFLIMTHAWLIVRAMQSDAKPFFLKILLHLEEQAVEGYTQLKIEYDVANEMLKTLLELNVHGKSL